MCTSSVLRSSAKAAAGREREARQGLSPRTVAESIAALLLRLKGHRIIARRYTTPVGEIDLVALKGKLLAFVEVKQRRSFDDAGWSLPSRARRRIVRAIGSQAIQAMPVTGLPSTVALAAPWAWPRYIANAFPV